MADPNLGWGSVTLAAPLVGATNPIGVTVTSYDSYVTLPLVTVNAYASDTQCVLPLPVVAASGETGAFASLELELPLPSVSAFYDLADMQIVLPLFELGGLSDCNVNLPLCTVDAVGISGTNTTVYQSTLYLPALQVSLEGVTGGLGNSELLLPLPGVSAEAALAEAVIQLPIVVVEATALVEQLGSSEVVLPQLAVEGFDNPHGTATFELPLVTVKGYMAVAGSGALAVELRLFALAAQGYTGRVGQVVVTLPLVSVAADGYGEYVGTVDVNLPILVVDAIGTSTALSPTFVAYALNTSTKALTEYQNFQFNSFGKMGSAYLAASDDGIYLLAGDVDGTAQIDASALSPLSDFGSGMMKRIGALYVRQRAEGNMMLTVTTEDNEGTEYLVPYTGATKLSTTRVDPVRGVSSVYWQLRYANTAGCDFELDSVDVLPSVLSRRRA